MYLLSIVIPQNDFPSSLWLLGCSEQNVVQWSKLTLAWLSLFPLMSLWLLIRYFCFNVLILFMFYFQLIKYVFFFFLEVARYKLHLKPKHGESEQTQQEVEEFYLMVRPRLAFLPMQKKIRRICHPQVHHGESQHHGQMAKEKTETQRTKT